jgi:HSP20 family molecular chaperone IbpA
MTPMDRFTEHDLSLQFDGIGCLWRFRPTAGVHAPQPLDVRVEGGDLLVVVDMLGLRAGDVEVDGEGAALRLRGATSRAAGLDSSVGLPRCTDLAQMRTTYADGVFEVRVPMTAEPCTLVEPLVAVA